MSPAHHREAYQPSPLDDVSDPEARTILASGEALCIGPPAMIDAGRHVIAATWDGRAFRTFGPRLHHRGTFASWRGAERDMLAALAEWDGVSAPAAE